MIKKVKCPSCGKTATKYYVTDNHKQKLIIKCTARKPCNYICIKEVK